MSVGRIFALGPSLGRSQDGYSCHRETAVAENSPLLKTCLVSLPRTAAFNSLASCGRIDAKNDHWQYRRLSPYWAKPATPAGVCAARTFLVLTNRTRHSASAIVTAAHSSGQNPFVDFLSCICPPAGLVIRAAPPFGLGNAPSPDVIQALSTFVSVSQALCDC